MCKNFSVRKKLFVYLTFVFVIFTGLVLIFQYNREKEFRKAELEKSLNIYSDIINQFIINTVSKTTGNYYLIDSLIEILPDKDFRITVIDNKGVVMYDSEVADYKTMGNHLQRPEVQLSKVSPFGSSIRKSATTGNTYYYYAKSYRNYYIRIAALYNINTRDLLKIDNLFIFYIILLFFVIWVILIIVIKNISNTISRLKDFAINLRNGNEIKIIDFPSDEIGQISSEIASIYNELNETKNEVLIEKNKLYLHLHTLNEGIAFFDGEKKKVMTNSHFIQYVNIISNKSSLNAEKIFEIEDLKEIKKFIDERLSQIEPIKSLNAPKKDVLINRADRYFRVTCIFSENNNFEIVIRDVSEHQRENIIKQQMTSNIAHELKTPVTSVMGYLETLKSNNIDKEKQMYFIEKAFQQACRLSELVEDIATLNKIEEAKERFVFSNQNLSTILSEINDHLKQRLDANKIQIENLIPDDLNIYVNDSLIYSIFYNLFDNAIKYGGENCQIRINKYLEDKDTYYFSFSNTGSNIDEKHLHRIFERFYRIDFGRTRKSGGTGLGLSIVKNAVLLHGGEISAKNLPEGGLEFLFTIKKNNVL